MQVTITITGNKQVKTKMKKLGTSLLDFSDAMKLIGKEVGQYYQNEAFNSQGGVYGRAWQKLSPKTVAAKARLYPQYTNVPLVATGTMRDSFTSVSSKSTVIISNKSPYYKYHQSTAPRTIMPRRKMAGINEPVKAIVKRLIEHDIKRKLEG